MSTDTDATLRTAMIDAAVRLLAGSPGTDISTRAVCEATGVTQPVLYRLFGDKSGLLDAVAEEGFTLYAARKGELATTDDPLADLHVGWDDHMAFARDNPALYQLMFGPRPGAGSAPYRRILELLEAALLRCAAAGLMRVDPKRAAQLILPVNVGLALSMIAQPDLFDDPRLSHDARDAVYAAILLSPKAQPAAEESPVQSAARQLRSQLTLSGTAALEDAESALLNRWLDRIVKG